MAVTTVHFETQLHSLEAPGYTVILLRDLLRRLAGEPVALPARAVVLTDRRRPSQRLYGVGRLRGQECPAGPEMVGGRWSWALELAAAVTTP